jgi:hypothetical protein
MLGLRSGAAKFKRDGNEPPRLSIKHLQQQPCQLQALSPWVRHHRNTPASQQPSAQKQQLSDLDQCFGSGWLK